MIGNEFHGDALRVGLVSGACIALIAVVTTQVLHVQAELAAMGPIILFLGYLVSSAWSPVPEWSPTLFWCASIILAALVELAFAYLL